jgi:hypothetical protein
LDGAIPAGDVIPDAGGHDDGLRGEDAADGHRIALVVIGAQDAARFLAAGIETAIELFACVLFDRTESYELMSRRH